jgi:hypothetical protein
MGAVAMLVDFVSYYLVVASVTVICLAAVLAWKVFNR